MGAGTGAPEACSAVATGAPGAILISTIGPTDWRFGTVEVKEGKLDSEEIGHKILRDFNLENLFDQEGSVPEFLISLSDGVHF